jgi:hypothetical protein
MAPCLPSSTAVAPQPAIVVAADGARQGARDQVSLDASVLAEIGSGRTRTHGKIEVELTDTYGQFARLHLSGKGVVEASA